MKLESTIYLSCTVFMRTHCEPGCFTKTLAEIPLPRALARSVEDDLPKESNEGSTLNHERTVGWEKPRHQLESSMTQTVAGLGFRGVLKGLTWPKICLAKLPYYYL